MNLFKKLMKEARELGAKVDTDWAEEHSALYDRFADRLEQAYDDGDLSARQFDELACTAFYDYPDLKGDCEEFD